MSKIAFAVLGLMAGGLAFTSYASLNGIGVGAPSPEIKKSPLSSTRSSDDDNFFFFSSSVRSGSSRSGGGFSSFGGK
ncbi:MAG: hypothetical protein RLY93_03725 [Sumerlaeia bacterium]